MADYLGIRAANSTVRFSFTTHAASGAAVAPSSGFENADLRIYKDGSATERASSSGVTMTSPFDSVTGLHHVDIDLSDNTTAGFYTAGSFYEVHLVPDETVDSLAVVKVLAYFEIGVPVANVTQFGGTAGTFASGRPEVNTTHAAGTAWNSGAIGASTLASDTITAAKIAADAIGASELAADAVTEIQAGLSTLTAAGVRSAIGLASANLDTQLDALPTAAENADAVWDEARSGHATAGTFGEGVASVQGAVGSVAAGGITAASIATGAIDADALAADAVDEILDEQIGDGTLTMRQALKVLAATLAGRVTGAATTTIVFRNTDDSADVITATVDTDGNRSAVTLNV